MRELSADERAMLLKIAEHHLVLRGNTLVWLNESGTSALADGENELLRGLWRGGYIWLPEDAESDRVAVSIPGRRVVQELRVFGEPPRGSQRRRGVASMTAHATESSPTWTTSASARTAHA
ncbi:MAG: hypothetical protein ACRDQX_10250 [Pseudonocardiaceae bacterium]